MARSSARPATATLLRSGWNGDSRTRPRRGASRSLGSSASAADLADHEPIGSYFTSTTRSFSGMIPLSVILMCSGHTSVQHFVMLQ